eukprot:365048-Chlamydomonas_euryale.AAC.22
MELDSTTSDVGRGLLLFTFGARVRGTYGAEKKLSFKPEALHACRHMHMYDVCNAMRTKGHMLTAHGAGFMSKYTVYLSSITLPNGTTR